MATLAQRIIDVVTAIGTDIKALTVAQGTLSGLSTTAKTNLVSAINEIYGLVGSGAVINDAVGDGNTVNTWSANKIFDTIEAAKLAVKNELVAGAATTLDTLSEIATALGNDPSFAATIATALGKRVRFDAAQVLTAGEKTQACANLGLGEPDTVFTTSYTAAKA